MRQTKAKAALKKAGVSQADIARMLGINRPIVCDAVKEGKSCVIGSRLYQARAKICEATGKKMEELWPVGKRNHRSAAK